MLPALMVLVFGIAELGLMLRATSTMYNIARQSARAAAAGDKVAVIRKELETCDGLDTTSLYLFMAYRAEGSSTWYVLGDDAYGNTAPTGAEVRAILIYGHKLLVPGLFGMRFGNQTSGVRWMIKTVTMRRA